MPSHKSRLVPAPRVMKDFFVLDQSGARVTSQTSQGRRPTALGRPRALCQARAAAGGQPLYTPIKTLWAWRAEDAIQRYPVRWHSVIGFKSAFGPDPIDSSALRVTGTDPATGVVVEQLVAVTEGKLKLTIPATSLDLTRGSLFFWSSAPRCSSAL